MQCDIAKYMRMRTIPCFAMISALTCRIIIMEMAGGLIQLLPLLCIYVHIHVTTTNDRFTPITPSPGTVLHLQNLTEVAKYCSAFVFAWFSVVCSTQPCLYIMIKRIETIFKFIIGNSFRAGIKKQI